MEGEYKGQWIRPISALDKCELADRDICYNNGQMPGLLDIISIAVKEHSPTNHQQENWIVDKSVPWKKEGELKIEQLSGLCDNTQTLWANDFDSTYGKNDKIPTDKVRRSIKSSLLLIRPQGVSYRVGMERNNSKKVRAVFHFKGFDYVIAVTDNSAENFYLAKHVGIYEDSSAPIYFCVSLAEDFHGYCYKLIAGIMQ